MLFNEPTSGNAELLNGGTQDVVDIVKAAGARLRQEGFADLKFVVPGEETEERSLEVASAILADPNARQYVGALAYHTYPYGSVYASVPRILATSGTGNPDPGRIAVRRQLRDLAAQYGLPLFMTEVSHGEVDPRSFDALRGRAIHIHDELIYADAAAYFGMNNMWDTTAQMLHFGNTDLFGPDAEGTIALIDDTTGVVTITGIGYAIGHYARWIRPGAVRVEAASGDPLVQVTAFDDAGSGRLVLVVVNNDAAQKVLQVRLAGRTLAGDSTGEQSTQSARWQAIAPIPTTAGGFLATVPPLSVTTFAAPLPAGPQVDGGPAQSDGGVGADAGLSPGGNGTAGGCGCRMVGPVAGSNLLYALLLAPCLALRLKVKQSAKKKPT